MRFRRPVGILTPIVVSVFLMTRHYPAEQSAAPRRILTLISGAFKDVFPFGARHKPANDLAASLEVLLIAVLFEGAPAAAGFAVLIRS